MTELVDKRVKRRIVLFKELRAGDFFEDNEGAVSMKVDGQTCLSQRFDKSGWIACHVNDYETWEVIPLKATITIKSEDERNE